LGEPPAIPGPILSTWIRKCGDVSLVGRGLVPRRDLRDGRRRGTSPRPTARIRWRDLKREPRPSRAGRRSPSASWVLFLARRIHISSCHGLTPGEEPQASARGDPAAPGSSMWVLGTVESAFLPPHPEAEVPFGLPRRPERPLLLTSTRHRPGHPDPRALTLAALLIPPTGV